MIPPGSESSSRNSRVGAVIVAAGSSSRMRGVDKIFALIAGKPLLACTVAAFEGCGAVDQIALVLSDRNLEQGSALVGSMAGERSSVSVEGERGGRTQ